MHDTIEYQIPRLGLVKFDLFPYANLAYEIINNSGLLDIMKKNPQLGIIKTAHEGAHHTRWEYVVIQLYLINKLSMLKLEGLSNNDPVIKNYKISGGDLLQTWTLLLNAGHLFGTFSNERGFCQALKNDRKLLNTFLSGLPKDIKIKEFLTNIVAKQNVYRLHQIISYFFLSRLKRKYKHEIDMMISILKLYHFADNKKRMNKLRNYFKKIRQSAFLFLDTNYGPVPILFEIGQILLDLENYIKEMFLKDASQLQHTLSLFEDLLSESFYLNPISMHAYGIQSRKTYNDIIKNDLYSINRLSNYLIDDSKLAFQQSNMDSYDFLRLWIDDNKVNSSIVKEIKPIEMEEAWNKMLPTSRCLCSIEKDPKNMMIGMTFSFKKYIEQRQLPRLFMQIIQLIGSFQRNKYLNSGLPKSIIYLSFEQICKEIILFLLNKIWERKYRFNYIYSEMPEMYSMEHGTSKAVKLIDKLITYYQKKKADSDRLNEILSLKQALLEVRHRGVAVFTTNQILITDLSKKSHITDIDTLAIISDSSELSLIVIQAKNQKKKSIGQATKQLNKCFEIFGLDSTHYPPIIQLDNYGVFSKVCLYSSSAEQCLIK
jgi:hypothetical protein